MLSEDGFGAQIWAAADRGDITYEQAPLVVRSLLSAGVDTTVNGLAAVLYAFASHPDQWARVRANPMLARTAFDEAVRWESPVQTFFRTATRDIEVGGTLIPDGRKILMFLAPPTVILAGGRARTLSISHAIRRAMSGSGWGSTNASASMSPASNRRLC